MERFRPCVSCQRSVNRIGGHRLRSYVLTLDFLQNNPYLMNYLAEVRNIHDHEVSQYYLFFQVLSYNDVSPGEE